MNSVDMATNLINRAMNLQEFTVTTEVPDNFKFNGLIPFDMRITEGTIYAKVYAVSFEEAVNRLNQFLESCEE
jgi:hypothetical protein